MKRMRLICVSVLALGLAFMATSCKKDKTETTSFDITTTSLEEDDADARVYLDFSDRNKMKWNGLDRIKIYNLDPEEGDAAIVQEFQTGPEAEGQVTATFHGPAVGEPQSDLGYFFFYPSKMASWDVDNDNRATFTVGKTQKYTEVRSKTTNARITTISRDDMAQASQKDNLEYFKMENIFGVARVYLVGNAEVAKVEIIDNYLPLTGQAKVCLPAVDPIELRSWITNYKEGNVSYAACWNYAHNEMGYDPTPDGNSVTVDCQNYEFEGVTYPGKQLTNPDAVSFLFCLRPGALSMGFDVKVYFTNGEGVILDKYHDTSMADLDNPREFTMVPGRIKGIYFKDAEGFDIAVDAKDANGDYIWPSFTWGEE